jgi:hypothetical protein
MERRPAESDGPGILGTPPAQSVQARERADALDEQIAALRRLVEGEEPIETSARTPETFPSSLQPHVRRPRVQSLRRPRHRTRWFVHEHRFEITYFALSIAIGLFVVWFALWAAKP